VAQPPVRDLLSTALLDTGMVSHLFANMPVTAGVSIKAILHV